MRRVLCALVVGSVVLVAAGCLGISFDGINDLSSDGGNNANSQLSAFTPQQIHDALAAKNFLLIDVHVPYAGKLPGTDASIPYNQPDAIAAFVGANLDTYVVLTCKSDSMSISAGNALAARGYHNVGYLIGGMDAWVAAGYSLVQ